MRLVVILVAGAVIIGLLIAVMGIIGPPVAVAGVLLALLVVVDPAGLGTRLRLSMAWWSIPGLRRASSGVLPFAGMVLLYTVPLPLAGFALAAARGAAPAPAARPPVAARPNTGGGPSVLPEAPPTPLVTAPPAPTVPPPSDTSTPTAALTPPPAPKVVVAPPPASSTPDPSASSGACGAPSNPWGYNFCGGGTISSPPQAFCDYFSCIRGFWESTNGYVVQCRDGLFSHSGGRSHACSSHGGVARPLNPAPG